MLPFDPADPFPLVGPGISYEQEKQHSALVDAYLGLETTAVEASLQPGPAGSETWQRQGPDTFLTPYSELRRMLALVNPRADWVVADLGAGYGRLGFVLHRHYALCDFVGVELVPERVAAGNRALESFGAGAGLQVGDLFRQPPPPADLYFVYDFGAKEAIRATLERLRVAARDRVVRLVGRGRAVRDQIEREHPWLGEVVPPVQGGNFTYYRSA